MNKYKLLILLFLLASYGVKSEELTEEEQTQLNQQLIEATVVEDKEALKTLLEKGTDVNTKNNDGDTATMNKLVVF